MAQDIIITMAKALATSTVGMIALAAVTETVSGWMPRLRLALEGLERMGSFLIVAVLIGVLLLGLWRGIPGVMKWIADRDQKFTEQLEREREARERSQKDFREMLQGHTRAVETALTNQTNHIDIHLSEHTKALHELVFQAKDAKELVKYDVEKLTEEGK